MNNINMKNEDVKPVLNFGVVNNYTQVLLRNYSCLC